MARICYVILAHNEPINLIGLLGSLWNREDSFSIWIDAKADPQLADFVNMLTGFASNIHAHLGRVMSWGGFSIVDTTLMAYTALQDQVGDFSHVVLCSGTHVPLLHPDQIYKRVRDCPGWMDVCQCAIPDGGLGGRDNLPRGWVQDILTRIQYRYAELPSVGMLPTRDRQNWLGPSLLEGSQWHILGNNLVDFIVGHQSEIRANFQDVLVPDEHAFQWAISKSPRFSELERGDHVFIQWEGASPKRLSFLEAAAISAQGRFLFARKAQASCAIEDWVAWARDRLANAEGAQWLQDASAALRRGACDSRADRSIQDGALCSRLVKALEVELTAASGSHTKLEKRSEWRYLIDSGRPHPSGGRLFFLCFAEPALGLAVVPALRHADLVDDAPMRWRPRVQSFWEFVNLPIGDHVGWSVGLTDPLSDSKELVRSVLAGL